MKSSRIRSFSPISTKDYNSRIGKIWFELRFLAALHPISAKEDGGRRHDML